MAERDPEIEATRRAWSAIGALPPEGRQNVVRWLAQKVGISGLAPKPEHSSRLELSSVVDFVRDNGETTTAEVWAAFDRWPNDYLYRAVKKGLLRRIRRGVYVARDAEVRR